MELGLLTMAPPLTVLPEIIVFAEIGQLCALDASYVVLVEINLFYAHLLSRV